MFNGSKMCYLDNINMYVYGCLSEQLNVLMILLFSVVIINMSSLSSLYMLEILHLNFKFYLLLLHTHRHTHTHAPTVMFIIFVIFSRNILLIIRLSTDFLFLT